MNPPSSEIFIPSTNWQDVPTWAQLPRGDTGNLSKPAASRLIGRLKNQLETAIHG